tara:strand:- start:317 stop:490 length:174 start_codon:yes stop_codon:yes gene_type:complete
MLDKLMKDLNEMNRLANVYYDNKQWALYEWIMKKITNTSTMISNYMDKVTMEVPADE